MKTLLRYFFESVQLRGGAPMIRELDAPSWSYEDVAMRAMAGAEQLAETGLGEGDRIIAYCDQTIPLTLLYLACAEAGILACPISPIFTSKYLREVARQSGANAVFALTDDVGRLHELGLPIFHFKPGRRDADKGTPSSGHEIVRPGRGRERLNRLFHDSIPLEDAMARLERAADRAVLEDSFLIQLTAGSSGQPKLVLRTFMAFSRYAQFVGDEVLKATHGDPFNMLAVNALTHAFAGHMFTMGMRLGATLCIAPGLDAATKLQHVRELDPDVLPMTPRVLRSFALQGRSEQLRRNEESRESPRLFGKRARLLLSAGGKGDIPTFQQLRAEGIEVVEFYGSSEASIIALTPHGKWIPDHAGMPVPDAELRIGRDGEIMVRSPGLFLGYLGDTDLSTLVFDDDMYFRTGDVGEIGTDNYVRILGRKRDVFNTPEGTNIFPERVEIRLESLPLVKQAMLVGDGRPYITAHLSIRGRTDHAPISPEEQADLYLQIAAEIAVINEELEHIERVIAFCLYGGEFDQRTYRSVSAGKVIRERKTFLDQYTTTVEQLYARELPRESPYLVGPERRYIDRVRNRR